MLLELRNLYLIKWACLYAGMNIVFNIIANESSSSDDDELEIIIRLAIEEERSRSHHPLLA